MNIRFILLALALVVGFTQVADAQCPNYALQFDGIDDAVAIDGLPASSTMTVEFWIYWDPNPNDTNYYAILSSLDDADYCGYRACIRDLGDGNGPVPTINFETDLGIPIWLGLGSYGAWHHMAIVYTGDETRYFIDGQGYNDTEGWFILGFSDPEIPPSSMHIGAGVGASHFDGMLDEIKVWNYARSGEEIRHEMFRHITTSDGTPATYYPFDEGRGTTTSWGDDAGTLLNGVAWVEPDLFIEYYDCPSCTNPNVTTQPVDASIYVGADATFTAASDDPDATIQWQFSDNGGADWYDIAGETSATHTVTNATMSLHGYRFRAAFTNACGTTYSDEAVLTVRIAVADLGPVDICVGTSTNSNNGKKIDLLVELFKNGTLIADGEVLNQKVSGSTSNNHSKRYSVALSSLPSGLEFDGDDILSCRVSVRRNGGSADFDVNLFYDDAPGSGSLKAESRIHKASGYYYFRTGDALSQTAGSSAVYVRQTASSSGYQEFGEWSMTGSALKNGRGANTLTSPYAFSAQLTSDGNLRITGNGTASVSLYDITGRKVWASAPIALPLSGGTYEMYPDHAGLTPGMYIITVSTGSQVKVLQYPVVK